MGGTKHIVFFNPQLVVSKLSVFFSQYLKGLIGTEMEREMHLNYEKPCSSLGFSVSLLVLDLLISKFNISGG